MPVACLFRALQSQDRWAMFLFTTIATSFSELARNDPNLYL